jgi:hypothetical protein
MAIPTTACGNGNPTDALCYGNTQLAPVVMVTQLMPCAMAIPTNACGNGNPTDALRYGNTH